MIILWGSIAAIQPLLNHGLQEGTYDAAIHLYRLLDLDQTFRAGVLFPWIAPHFALDYGYATFTFYPPLGVYLGEAFRLFGLGYIASLKASFAAAVLASGLGAYLLARDIFGWRAAMAVAFVYVYVPYRLLDLYVRGDLAESLAQAILPFAFWSLWRVAQLATPGRVASAGVAVGTLILAHNITALFTTPLLLGFLAVSSYRTCTRRRLIGIGVAGIVGLGLSAIYWLPVLTQLGEVNTVALTTGQFDYHNEFIPLSVLVQQHWAYDYELLREAGDWFNVGRVEIILAALATVWVILARAAQRGILIFAAASIVFLLWMQQAGSAVVWDHLPFARYIQFPSRLSTYIGLMTALLLGAFVVRPEKSSVASSPGLPDKRWLLLVGTALEIAVVAAFLTASLWSMPRRNATLQEFEVNVPTVWRRENGSGLIAGNTQGDYLPTSVHSRFFQNANLPPPAEHVQSPVRLTAVWSSPLNLVATTDADAPGPVLVDRLYYPGWRATVDDRPVPIDVDEPLGIIRIAVPGGHHTLRISDVGTPFERAGLAISVATALIIVLIIVRPRHDGWRWRLALVAMGVSLAGANVATRMRPPQPLVGGVDFGHSVRLVGSRLDRVPGAQRGAIDVTLIWEALEAPLPTCSVHLQLLDAGGEVIAHRDKEPLFGLRPCSQWRAGEIIRDHEQIRLPPGVAPGQYRLSLGLTLGGQILTPTGGDPPGSPRQVILGTVDALPPPSFAQLPGSFPVGATIGGYFSLDAARIRSVDTHGHVSPPSSDPRFLARIKPGDRVQVDLLWRSLADAPADYAVFAQMLDANQRRVAQHDSWPDTENSPTFTWFPTDTVVDRHTIDTKPSLAPGVYTLIVGMYNRVGLVRLPTRGNFAGQNALTMGKIKVTNVDHTFGHTVAVVSHRAVFGGQIALDGIAISPTSPAHGGSITVDLAWRAVSRPENDYTVFVHVLDHEGKLVSQHDAPPLAGAYPTGDWDPGDRIFDEISVPIPRNLPSGEYAVEVGLYQLKTGARLLDTSGRSSLEIGTLDVR